MKRDLFHVFLLLSTFDCVWLLVESLYICRFFGMLVHFEGKNEVEFLRVCFISSVGKKKEKDLVSMETLYSFLSRFWFSGV